jgi:ribonuclease VapC
VIAVDTSAIIAILQYEPEVTTFLRCITEADVACLSAVSFQEASLVLAGSTGNAEVWRDLDALMAVFEMEIVPYTEDLVLLARDAFLRFGKGRGHPAQLNFGDCAAYALAKSRNIPLLYKGDDFARTDIVSATVRPA